MLVADGDLLADLLVEDLEEEQLGDERAEEHQDEDADRQRPLHGPCVFVARRDRHAVDLPNGLVRRGEHIPEHNEREGQKHGTQNHRLPVAESQARKRQIRIPPAVAAAGASWSSSAPRALSVPRNSRAFAAGTSTSTS